LTDAAKATPKAAAAQVSKPGYQTTEFYVTIATLLGSMLSAVSGGLPSEWAAGVSGGVVAAYAIARAVVKIGAALFAGYGFSDK
jgi:hypothetical protein